MRLKNKKKNVNINNKAFPPTILVHFSVFLTSGSLVLLLIRQTISKTPQALAVNGDTDSAESSLCLEEVASAKPPEWQCHLWMVLQVLVFSGSGNQPLWVHSATFGYHPEPCSRVWCERTGTDVKVESFATYLNIKGSQSKSFSEGN